MKKEVSCKNVIVIFLVFILLGILFSFLIFNDYDSIKKINVGGLTNDDIVFAVDSIENTSENKYVSIKGWAFRKNEDLQTVKTYIALKNTKTSEVFEVNTAKEDRKDVTSAFNGSYNYDSSGFFAKFNKNELKDKGEYEICILYMCNDTPNFNPTRNKEKYNSSIENKNKINFVETGKFIDIS